MLWETTLYVLGPFHRDGTKKALLLPHGNLLSLFIDLFAKKGR